jgi:hypothetical protein
LDGKRRAIETRRKDKQPRRRGVARGDSQSARQRKFIRNRYRSDFDGRHRLNFDGGKSIFHLQLISPISEVATVLLHRQLHVGWDEQGYALYANAISPRDPALDGSLAYDPALEHGRRLWQATIGTAAFIMDGEHGWQLDSAIDGNGEIVPAVGLLVEDTAHFWNALLTTIPNPDGRLLRVRRSGKWHHRKFTFEDVGEAIPMDIPCPDLDAYLDEIGDPVRLSRLVAEQPESATLKLHL